MKTHLLKKRHHRKREERYVVVTHRLIHKTMKTNRLKQNMIIMQREKNCVVISTHSPIYKAIQLELTSYIKERNDRREYNVVIIPMHSLNTKQFNENLPAKVHMIGEERDICMVVTHSLLRQTIQ